MTRGGEPALLRRAVRVRAALAPTTLTPVHLPEGLLVVRSPRLSDGPAWSSARIANRKWLERAFPAWGDDWVAEQSEVAWAQRWARLRRQSAAGRALPFVLTLDGRLVGELGIDAVDPVTGAGEASVWVVRSHGSPAVIQAAILLLVEHAFTRPRPMARILSPVATSSRRGRTPGLTSVGFAIEGTVPRRIGAQGLVDHDIWVVHNTADVRRTTTEKLRMLRDSTTPTRTPTEGDDTQTPGSPGSAVELPAVELPAVELPAAALPAAAAGRAALREVRGAVRRLRARADARLSEGRHDVSRRPPGTLRPVTRRDPDLAGTAMPTDTTRWAVEADGRLHAVLGHRDDVGTATTEVFVATRPGADRDLLAVATGALLDDLRPGADEARLLVVRVPARAPSSTTLDDDMLTALGLERLATFRGHPDSTHEWDGEDLWRMPASS